MEVETIGHTLAEVKDKRLVDTLADRLAVEEVETLGNTLDELENKVLL